MAQNGFEKLTPVQQDAAQSALTASFGHTPVDSVITLSGGASGASAFRVEIRGRYYLLRIEGPASPLRNPYQYTSMTIAAEAGIAPAIHHIDEAAGVALMDYIAHHSLQAFPGGAHALMQSLGELLARLQDTPTFPSFVEYPDIVARLFAYVRRTGLFTSGLLDKHVERLAELQNDYTTGRTRLVSSHNDSNPRNILFDGKRLWLIDWESAYCNDPLVDVAIVADCLAPSPELEYILLRAWLGRAPDEELKMRLTTVRALTQLYFAGVLLSASAAASRPVPDSDLSAPTLREFEQAITNGTLSSGTPETKHILGKMYLASFYSGARAPGLEAAV